MGRIVNVRALPRPGFNCFFRGGHRWPEDGRTVEVTDELFKVLRAEKMLAVETPSDEDEAKLEDKVLGLNIEYCSDPEHNATRGAREENVKLKAQLEAQSVLLENERLKAALAESEELRVEREEHARLTREVERKRLREEAAKMQEELADVKSQAGKDSKDHGDKSGKK